MPVWPLRAQQCNGCNAALQRVFFRKGPVWQRKTCFPDVLDASEEFLFMIPDTVGTPGCVSRLRFAGQAFVHICGPQCEGGHAFAALAECRQGSWVCLFLGFSVAPCFPSCSGSSCTGAKLCLFKASGLVLERCRTFSLGGFRQKKRATAARVAHCFTRFTRQLLLLR